MGGHAKDEQAALRATEAVAVLAEMERHGSPDVRLYYGSKLRAALGVVGPVECTCGSCRANLRHPPIDESWLFTAEKPIGGVGLGLGTGLPNDVDYSAIELRMLAYLNGEPDPTVETPTCPTCGKPLTSVSEDIVPKVRKLCEPMADDREDGKRYRRYEPCGHVIEVDESDA